MLIAFCADDVQLLQLAERVQGASERRFVSYAQLEATEAQVLQGGEDRFVERVEEALKSGGADETLGEWSANPAALSPDAPN